MARPSARAARVAPAVRAVTLALLVALAPLAPLAGTAGALHGVLAFGDTIHNQQRGDVVRFDVYFADAEPPHPLHPEYNATTANVSIRGHGYEAVVEVHDDGDGHVGFRFNTYAAGRGRPNGTFGVATPGDRVTVRRATTTDGLLPAGRYNVSGAIGNVSKESEEDTVGLLFLEEPGLRNLTVLRGSPGLSDTLETPGDVAAARRDGRLDRAYERRGSYTGGTERSVPVVGQGETLVLALRASGLGGRLAAAEGRNATARFESLLGRELTFAVEWVPQPQFDRRRYRFESFAERRVVPDPRNDTYYLVVAPSAGATPASGVGTVDFDDVGCRYETTVAVPPDGRLVAGNSSDTTTNFTFVPPHAEVTVDAPVRLLVPDEASVTLPLTTTLRPGTELAVRIRGPTGRYVPPDRRVTVNASGRATISVDPTNVSPGDRFAVVLSRDGSVLGEFEGQVATATVDFRDRSVDDDASAVVVDAVGTSVGGFVALHRDGPNGSVVGSSTYLAPGDHVDVRVPLRQSLDGDATLWAVMHWNVDADREFTAADRRFGTSLPGHLSGEPVVAAAANVTLVEAPSTVESSTTPSSASLSRRTPTRSGQSPVPGFGSLLALVALVAAAMGRCRR